MKRRIAILGGTFDPIHIGHLAIAEDVRFALDAAQVIFVPAAQQPFKANVQSADAEHRLAMARLATADNGCFAVSDIEILRGGVSYTVETVAQLHKQLSDAELYFIVGADAALDLPRWFNVERLLQLSQIVVVERPGYRFDEDILYTSVPSARGRLVRVEGPALAISASELRERLCEGKPARYHLSSAVMDYIQTHGLYQKHDVDHAT
jgi:nicotinate-nucleotide adenylyltransferase